MSFQSGEDFLDLARYANPITAVITDPTVPRIAVKIEGARPKMVEAGFSGVEREAKLMNTVRVLDGYAR